MMSYAYVWYKFIFYHLLFALTLHSATGLAAKPVVQATPVDIRYADI